MNKTIFIISCFAAMISIKNSYGLETCITHKENMTSLPIAQLRRNLEKKDNLSLPLDEEITLLDQLSQFELGRFLLMNKGLNGYWTAYIILHGPKQKNLHSLEEWMLYKAPTIKATRERFSIFQNILQKHLRNDITLASIPYGLMDDLITLDYGHTKNVRLVGIDFDQKSLDLAQNQSKKINISHVEFIQSDAWTIQNHEEFDIITSNGLNIYEPDDEKVTALYRKFYQALKAQGLLVTSFLTPPPSLSQESPWQNVNSEDALKQKAIFSDIIGVTWQTFRTEAKTRAQLEKAGFKVLEVINDTQGIFPTVVAQKP